jgi:allophanate hydrolase
VLVTPTVARPFRVSEMLAEPIVRNAEVGHYTYGVGPLDLCALALPAAIRPDGLPFGISLVGRARADGWLRALGHRFEASTGMRPGAAGRRADRGPQPELVSAVRQVANPLRSAASAYPGISTRANPDV